MVYFHFLHLCFPGWLFVVPRYVSLTVSVFSVDTRTSHQHGVVSCCNMVSIITDLHSKHINCEYKLFLSYGAEGRRDLHSLGCVEQLEVFDKAPLLRGCPAHGELFLSVCELCGCGSEVVFNSSTTASYMYYTWSEWCLAGRNTQWSMRT